MKVKIKKLSDLATLPKYQTTGSSGFDFHSTEDCVIMPGDIKLIGTGLSFELPEGTELQVRPRSGISAKTKIRVANSPGTIDRDFTGEVKIILDNTGSLPYTVKVGDRIAQGIVCPVYKVELVEVTELSDTERGSGGFGSSGN